MADCADSEGGSNGRRIVVLTESMDIMARAILDAIYRFGKPLGWDVNLVKPSDGESNGKWTVPGLLHDCSFRVAMRHLRPDGVVSIGCRPAILRDRTLCGIPMVSTGNDVRQPHGVACVRCDNRDIVRTAANELFRSGWRHYAFVGWTTDKLWIRQREAEFRRLVGERGATYHLLDCADIALSLGRLPRPCGIFAANDFVGAKVVSAALRTGFRVPDDFAVVGVDNDLQTCENAPVTLTSVEQDSEACGRRAAEALQRAFDGGTPRDEDLTFGALTLVRRASTRFFVTDRRVAQALEYIRMHVADPVKVPAVASVMGCSRNMADLLFKRQCRQTVHDAILASRICKAQELLRRPAQDLASLHDFCGFASAADLRRTFKRETGLTLTAWRKRL